MMLAFFIPNILLALLCTTTLVGRFALGGTVSAICAWVLDNFTLFAIAAVLLLLGCAAVFWIKHNLRSAIAFFFASSQLTALLLGLFHEILWIHPSFSIFGWFGVPVMILALAISLSYLFGNAFGIALGIAHCSDPCGSASVLWAVGIVGWFANLLVCPSLF